MISKALTGASTKPIVLAILKRGESYGYEIIQQVKDITGGELVWSEPMLYPFLKRITHYFDIPTPQDPQYPKDSISVSREELNSVLDQLAEAGVPIKADREQVWEDFAGWRENYDRSLLVLCSLVMAPHAVWSSDRAPRFNLPPLFILKKKL